MILKHPDLYDDHMDRLAETWNLSRTVVEQVEEIAGDDPREKCPHDQTFTYHSAHIRRNRWFTCDCCQGVISWDTMWGWAKEGRVTRDQIIMGCDA